MNAKKKLQSNPNFSLVRDLQENYQFKKIIGLDEVGRGAIAGPIVVAAVELNVILPNVCDSKKLSYIARQELTPLILANAEQVTLGIASSEEIDQLGIVQAQEIAYARALENIVGDLFLTDFIKLVSPGKNIRAIKGDSLFYPVAAASIIAKTYRDQLMRSYHNFFPDFNWFNNVGYGTVEHKLAIKKSGISPLHRKTFLEKSG